MKDLHARCRSETKVTMHLLHVASDSCLNRWLGAARAQLFTCHCISRLFMQRRHSCHVYNQAHRLLLHLCKAYLTLPCAHAGDPHMQADDQQAGDLGIPNAHECTPAVGPAGPCAPGSPKPLPGKITGAQHSQSSSIAAEQAAASMVSPSIGQPSVQAAPAARLEHSDSMVSATVGADCIQPPPTLPKVVTADVLVANAAPDQDAGRYGSSVQTSPSTAASAQSDAAKHRAADAGVQHEPEPEHTQPAHKNAGLRGCAVRSTAAAEAVPERSTKEGPALSATGAGSITLSLAEQQLLQQVGTASRRSEAQSRAGTGRSSRGRATCSTPKPVHAPGVRHGFATRATCSTGTDSSKHGHAVMALAPFEIGQPPGDRSDSPGALADTSLWQAVQLRRRGSSQQCSDAAHGEGSDHGDCPWDDAPWRPTHMDGIAIVRSRSGESPDSDTAGVRSPAGSGQIDPAVQVASTTVTGAQGVSAAAAGGSATGADMQQAPCPSEAPAAQQQRTSPSDSAAVQHPLLTAASCARASQASQQSCSVHCRGSAQAPATGSAPQHGACSNCSLAAHVRGLYQGCNDAAPQQQPPTSPAQPQATLQLPRLQASSLQQEQSVAASLDSWLEAEQMHLRQRGHRLAAASAGLHHMGSSSLPPQQITSAKFAAERQQRHSGNGRSRSRAQLPSVPEVADEGLQALLATELQLLGSAACDAATQEQLRRIRAMKGGV